ncbi:protein neuralized-like isoform X2 [Ctenocephalides felis]|uniref:protein neuralized-like isoform X2 n=1 Tax=Ctenocephalides felis TaxID=7515 RepID=UPI000E6E3DCA|nr:protein neuralized-like isoform X2 [Ctenocephalides felis]XP_026475847.1 protein neuralized-like isoform X2 [Ctenocephalides felis]
MDNTNKFILELIDNCIHKLLRNLRIVVPRSSSVSCPGPNNLTPLLFHTVHGENIRISRDGTCARRCESFCKGITFSARPVRIGERVYVKFSEISDNWSGVIRFGFTSNDPSSLKHALPKYACPDLTNKPGYWAKALAERFCEKNNVLFYYVNATGDVHFGVNGDEKGIFFSGVETRSPLWTLIDVYGNCTGIEFLDPRIQVDTSYERPYTDSEFSGVISSMQTLTVHEELPAPRFTLPAAPSPASSSSMPFHWVRGRNVRFSADRTIASRVETEFSQGYVFTARPIRIGEKLIVHVMSTEPMFVGALALGLTSCDPATLTQSDLPDDSDMLLDRPEYWVVTKTAGNPERDDRISFCVTATGEVHMSKNDGPRTVVMHVDQSLQLWAFLDIYGSTQSVRMTSDISPPIVQPPSQRLHVCLSASNVGSESMNNFNSQAEQRQRRLVASSGRFIQMPSTTDMMQVQSVTNGGAYLVVNLPPPHASLLSSSSNHHNNVGSSGKLVSNYNNSYPEAVSSSCSAIDNNGPFPGEECTICYENPIDCVLYMCGHMCMCYECAIQQWRGKGGGHCPLCRAVIRDVIRTYKSC